MPASPGQGGANEANVSADSVGVQGASSMPVAGNAAQCTVHKSDTIALGASSSGILLIFGLDWQISN